MWFVYIVRCNDNSLYTGITINLERRLLEHNGLLRGGAKSIRGKRPIYLVHKEQYNTRPEALKREKEIKGWKRNKKLSLIGPALRSETTKGA